MVFPCEYIQNPVRALAQVESVLKGHASAYVPLFGNLIKSGSNYKALSDKFGVLVMSWRPDSQGLIRRIVTNDRNHLEELQCIDTVTGLETMTPRWTDLLFLLKGRQARNGNPFTIEFSSNMGVISITADKVEETENTYRLTASVHGSSSGVLLVGDEAIHKFLIPNGCESVKGFSCSYISSQYERHVDVKRGLYEILREVSRYLGYTIGIMQIGKHGEMIFQYINYTGITEVVWTDTGVRQYRRITPGRTESFHPQFVFVVSQTPEEIAREMGAAFSRRR